MPDAPDRWTVKMMKTTADLSGITAGAAAVLVGVEWWRAIAAAVVGWCAGIWLQMLVAAAIGLLKRRKPHA